MSDPKIWAGDHGEFIVETREQNGLRYGYLITDGVVSHEQPLDTIARFMPYTDFQPYTGDPAPILAKLKGG